MTFNLLIYRLALGSIFRFKNVFAVVTERDEFQAKRFYKLAKIFSLNICFCFNRNFILVRGVASSVFGYSPE